MPLNSYVGTPRRLQTVRLTPGGLELNDGIPVMVIPAYRGKGDPTVALFSETVVLQGIASNRWMEVTEPSDFGSGVRLLRAANFVCVDGEITIAPLDVHQCPPHAEVVVFVQGAEDGELPDLSLRNSAAEVVDKGLRLLFAVPEATTAPVVAETATTPVVSTPLLEAHPGTSDEPQTVFESRWSEIALRLNLPEWFAALPHRIRQWCYELMDALRARRTNPTADEMHADTLRRLALVVNGGKTHTNGKVPLRAQPVASEPPAPPPPIVVAQAPDAAMSQDVPPEVPPGLTGVELSGTKGLLFFRGDQTPPQTRGSRLYIAASDASFTATRVPRTLASVTLSVSFAPTGMIVGGGRSKESQAVIDGLPALLEATRKIAAAGREYHLRPIDPEDPERLAQDAEIAAALEVGREAVRTAQMPSQLDRIAALEAQLAEMRTQVATISA